MPRTARTLLWILAVAVLVHALIIIMVPSVVMHIALRKTIERAGANTPFHAHPITAADRGIPLPSPDLLYSTCALDLSQGPVHISVTPGSDYLSLALFDLTTDNVFVASDKTSGGKKIDLLVIGPNAPEPIVPIGTDRVRMASQGGLLLLRGLAATPEMRARNDIVRHTLVCEPVGLTK